MRSYSGRSLIDEHVDQSNFRTIVSKLTLADLNKIFFHCKAEEEAEGNGYSTYNVPGYGDMVYCGLRGNIFTSKVSPHCLIAYFIVFVTIHFQSFSILLFSETLV